MQKKKKTPHLNNIDLRARSLSHKERYTINAA